MNIIDHGFNRIEIYQIKDIANCDYAFRSYEEAERTIWGYHGEMTEDNAIRGVQIMDYKKVYEYDEWFDSDSDSLPLLEKVFCKFNIDRPADFKGHSLSVSDLICVNEESWYYVDDIGFKHIGDFEYHFFKGEEFRVCSECGDVMQDGFMEETGLWYCCSEECLLNRMPWDEYLEMYEADEAFYTQWF